MTDGPNSSQPAAGWYAAPSQPGRQRYWDGMTWTDQFRDEPSAAGGGREKKPFWKRWWFIAGAIVVLLAALAGNDDGGDTTDLVAGGTNTTPVTEADEPPATSEARAAATTSTTTTSTTRQSWEGFTLTGRGADVVDLVVPDGDAAVLNITHQGSSNFAITGYDASGEYLDLLVNEIGNYEGSRPVNLVDGDTVAELEIEADGEWTIEVVPLVSLPVSGDQVTGHGDQILVVGWTGGRLAVTHDGESNFVVLTYGQSGTDLAINVIGPYDGTIRLDSNVFIVEVQADGKWTLFRS